ncbi:hypothetical protein PENTCL1PPCAC_7451, partial [Pristionchus entomophagus]
LRLSELPNMPKFRVRPGGAKIKKRYAPGKGSESNPEKNRHRAAANAMRAANILQEGTVAVDERAEMSATDIVLDQLNLDTMSLGRSNGDGGLGAKSMVSEGRLTSLTAFTSCTNPNFDAVHRVWKSGSNMQTEVVAVLAAVAEIIKEKGGSESDVEYMAALLVTLEGLDKSEPGRVAATAYLLHLIIKKVPREILQANFTSTANIIYTKILEHTGSDESSILKNLLTVLGVVLRAQPAAVFNNPQTKNMIVSVCALCTHERPWVRTMARRVARAVLTDPVTALDNGLHAAATPVAQFILQQLQQAIGSKNGVLMSTRWLCLLEGIMHKFPASLFKQLTEVILRSFTIVDPTVKCSAMQCLQRALERQPCDTALTAETCELLVESLRGLAPPTADITVVAHWMQAITEAQICLSAKDAARSSSILQETTECLAKHFSLANEPLAQLTYQLLSKIIDCCIQDDDNAAKTLLGLLHRSLHVQSAPVWRFVVRTQMRLFEKAGASLIGKELEETLKTLAEMREAEHCLCRPEIDFTIGSAVRHVGAGPVLSVIKLQLDPDAAILPLDLPRSWLIPVLRVNLHNAQLSLFLRYFLPIAIKLHRRLPSLEGVQSRLYSLLQLQLWELLPPFLESPGDFETTFPTLAPILGTAILERRDLRMIVLSGLRAALGFVHQPDAPAARVETMARFAQNFQPILFNLYTEGAEDDHDDRQRRLSALETIRLYAESTPRDLIARYIGSALTKIGETDSDPSKQARILDIVTALVKNADPETTKNVLSRALVWSEKQAKKKEHLQKKAYRIIDEIMKRKGESDLEAVFSEFGEPIVTAVTRPVEQVVAQARSAQMAAARLVLAACSDLKRLQQLAIDTLKNVIPTLDKTQSTSTRSSASKTLQEMLTLLVTAGIDNGLAASTVLAPLLTYIFETTVPRAGGTGEVPLETAQGSLVALNIIAQKQVKNMNASHTSQMVSHSTTWMVDGRASVRLLAIRLMRVLLQKMSGFMVDQFRELILTSFFGQNMEDTTIKIRKANRLLLGVIMERMGIHTVQRCSADKPEWARVVKSMEKEQRRKERKAMGAVGQEDMDGEDDALSTATSRTSGRTAGADTILGMLEDSDDEEQDKDSEVQQSRVSRRSSVWLKEDDESTPLDLLDRKNLANKVSTTDPFAANRRREKAIARREKNHGFKIGDDGKIVIDLDEIDYRRKKKEDEDDEVPEKRRRVDKDSDEEDSLLADDEEKKSSWRPGGQGIHRDTSKSVVSGASGMSKVSKISRASTTKSGRGGRKGDEKKKDKKGVQPYAYVPLSKLRKGQGAKQELKSLVGRKRKAAGNRATRVQQ